jgi:GST-like protein
MTGLSAFPITRKWPAQHPDRIQLYSLPTPNGIKVSIMLEETGLPYEPHPVSFEANEQFSPEFSSLNPNNKIPAILDPNGPDGAPFPLFESGAILIYLAEKTGQFMPRDAARRYQTIQWLMFQMGGIGPMFGQLGFFHKFAGKEYEDKRPRDRYVAESKRLLGVLDLARCARHRAARSWRAARSLPSARMTMPQSCRRRCPPSRTTCAEPGIKPCFPARCTFADRINCTASRSGSPPTSTRRISGRRRDRPAGDDSPRPL